MSSCTRKPEIYSAWQDLFFKMLDNKAKRAYDGAHLILIKVRFWVMKMRRIKILFGLMLLVVPVVVASCGGAAQGGKQVDNAELERNHQLWRESGIVNYRMTVDLQKTGHATPMGKFIIEVRDGRAVSVKSATDPRIVPDAERFQSYATLEDIFGIIGGASRRQPEKMDVEYEPKLGYPKRLHLDYKASTMDDELFFQVLEFEKL